MDENISTPIVEEPVKKALNPWFSMWLQPRRTMRLILDCGVDEQHLLILAALGGVAQFIDRAEATSFGDSFASDYTWLFAVIMALIIGPIGGIIGLYIQTALIGWTGRWIGGKADSKEIKAALAWSNVPLIWGLIIIALELILFGNEMFTSATPIIDNSALLSAVYGILLAIDGVIAVWYIVIVLKCIGEVQGFSAWKALLNVILSVLVVVVPILLLLTPLIFLR